MAKRARQKPSESKRGAIQKKSNSGSDTPEYTTKSGTKYAPKDSVVNEAAVSFDIASVSSKHKNQIAGAAIIVGKMTKPEWRLTAIEKMAIVRKGVSKESLESLKRKANLDYDKLSSILSTTRATLINKKGAEQFGAALSERIVSIAEIYSFGFEVFGEESNFNEWIFKPNQALGGLQPFELLDNQFGREEVKNLIGRIDYGVYS